MADVHPTGARALAVASGMLLAGAVGHFGAPPGGRGGSEARSAAPEPRSLFAAQEPSALRRPTPEDLAYYRQEAEESGEPRDWFNLGAALLLSGDRRGAHEPLERAAVRGDGEVRQRALYDLGVAYADATQGEPVDPAERRALLLQAREAFRRALMLDPTDSDARWNLELVERWLDQPASGGGGGGGAAGGGGGAAGGAAGAAGASEGDRAPRLTREEAEAILDAAAQGERETRAERRARRGSREPVVERDW